MHTLLDLSQIARAAAASCDHLSVTQAVTEIEARLRLPRGQIEAELHGRKPVDALLNLALAGCATPWIFTELCDHAEHEVRRWGRRRSCTSMTLAQLAERAAAAGCVGPLGLFDALGEILIERAEPVYAHTARTLASGDFSLASSEPAACAPEDSNPATRHAHAAARVDETRAVHVDDARRARTPRSPVRRRWVYRASSRQGKQASAGAGAFGGADWGDAWSGGAPHVSSAFGDATRPLTVDLGCGARSARVLHVPSCASPTRHPVSRVHAPTACACLRSL
jgi:hypothetical protein